MSARYRGTKVGEDLGESSDRGRAIRGQMVGVEGGVGMHIVSSSPRPHEVRAGRALGNLWLVPAP